MRYQPLSLIAAALAAAGTARAQDEGAPTSRRFTGIIGVGVAAMPKYLGSDEYRVVPIPVAQLEYGRLFLGGSQSSVGVGVGAHVVRTSSLGVDVNVMGAESRPEHRGAALAGMGKRSAASFAGADVSYRVAGVSATAGFGVGLGDDEGTYGTVGLATERMLARRWVGGVSTGATFGDARNMAFDFGVSGEQSARRRALIAAGDTRLRGIDGSAYTPDAGLKETHAAATLGFLLTERSRVVAFARGSHLAREAARSPLVRERTGVITGMAVGYGF